MHIAHHDLWLIPYWITETFVKGFTGINSKHLLGCLFRKNKEGHQITFWVKAGWFGGGVKGQRGGVRAAAGPCLIYLFLHEWRWLKNSGTETKPARQTDRQTPIRERQETETCHDSWKTNKQTQTNTCLVLAKSFKPNHCLWCKHLLVLYFYNIWRFAGFGCLEINRILSDWTQCMRRLICCSAAEAVADVPLLAWHCAHIYSLCSQSQQFNCKIYP